MEITLEMLEEMQKVDLKTADPADLVDIRDVKIDTSLPVEERLKSLIAQIKNPYLFKCGKSIVKVRFNNESNITLEEAFAAYLRSLI